MGESGKYKRHNILDLRSKYPEKFGIFIMALKNLINSDDWGRICGIHGNTFNKCDRQVKCPTDPATVTKIGATGEPFYCKHSVYSFIAWHNPYVYQFELLLNKYNRSKNQSYVTLPWLDLTDTNSDYGFINDPEITIFYDSQLITTENPLSTSYYYVECERVRIVRNGFLTATNNKEYIQINTLKKQFNDAMKATNYEEFSSAANKDVKYTPLEAPHNSIHNIIGGEGGNMSEIPIAAFDPLFWLHHCNMDRYYYSWYSNITNNFSEPLYPKYITEETMNKPCAPFFKNHAYSTDYNDYDYGWTNCTGMYAQVSDIIDIYKLPYTYDIVPRPLLQSTFTSYISIAEVKIPPESIELNAYMYKKGSELDRENNFAGSVFYFGINQEELHCVRCKKIKTNFKINIDDFVQQNNINENNIGEYEIIFEARGLLIKDKETTLHKTYKGEELFDTRNIQIVVPKE